MNNPDFDGEEDDDDSCGELATIMNTNENVAVSEYKQSDWGGSKGTFGCKRSYCKLQAWEGEDDMQEEV